ncbi:Transcription factor [Schizosaccharomyces pombe]
MDQSSSPSQPESQAQPNLCIPCSLGTCLIHFHEFSSSSFMDPVSLFCSSPYPNLPPHSRSSSLESKKPSVASQDVKSDGTLPIGTNNNPSIPSHSQESSHWTIRHESMPSALAGSSAQSMQQFPSITQNEENFRFKKSFTQPQPTVKETTFPKSEPGQEHAKLSDLSYEEFLKKYSSTKVERVSEAAPPPSSLNSSTVLDENDSLISQGSSVDDQTDFLGFDDSLSYAYILNPTSDSDVDLIRQYFIPKEGTYTFSNMHIRYVSANPKTPVMYMVDPAYEPHKQIARYEKLQQIFQVVEATVSPEVGERLIGLYFRYIHRVYPVIHGERFLLAFKKAKHKLSPILLTAMYASSIIYWDADKELRNYPRLDAKKLWDLTEDFLDLSFSLSRLSTLQAAIIFLTGRPWINVAGNWSILTRAIALAQILGFHLDCSEWQIPKEEKILRNRVWWALFVNEKWLSMYIGINASIRQDDYLVPPLTDNQLLAGEQRIADSFNVFVKMAELSILLQNVLQHLFNARAVMTMSKNRRTVAQKISKYLISLEEFSCSCNLRENQPGSLSLFLQIDALELLLRKTALKLKLTDAVYQQEMLNVVQRCVSHFLAINESHFTDFFWPYSQFYFCILSSAIIKMYLDFEFNENFNATTFGLLSSFTKHCVWLKFRNFDLVFMAYKRLNALLIELSSGRPLIGKLLQETFEHRKRNLDETLT